MRSATLACILVAVVAALLCGQPVQSQTGNISVTGQIVRDPCTIKVGGTLEYGWISKHDLDDDKSTSLKTRTMPLEIECPRLRSVSLTFEDGHASSKVVNLKAGEVPADFGLALSNNRPVGAIALQIERSQSGSNNLEELIQTGAGWTRNNGVMMAGQAIAWHRKNSTPPYHPESFVKITAELKVTPVIVPRKQLPRNDWIGVEGRIHGELTYL